MSIDLKSLKINWNKFYVLKEYNKNSVFFLNGNLSESTSKINAEDYFIWAISDWKKYREGMNIKTRVEVISNIKRFIDCYCENFLRQCGFIKEINIKNYPYISNHIVGNNPSIIELFAYLTSLNMIIISEIRKLRNSIEHDYINPSIDDVKRAISVAELFILATKFKINNIIFFCTISSKKYDDKFNIGLFKESSIESYILINNIKIKSNEKYYCELLRMLINNKFIELPNICGCKVPTRNISYEIYDCEDDVFQEEYDEVKL